jgi:hypothetical protein
MTREHRGIGAALAAFGKAYGRGRGHQEDVGVSSGTDRGCPKSAMGEGPGNGERKFQMRVINVQ